MQRKFIIISYREKVGVMPGLIRLMHEALRGGQYQEQWQDGG